MIMAIIFVEPVGILLISSVLCGPKKNYKIGLTVYQKKKKRRKDRVAYSARTAHPFQRNGAPFRFKLSKAQQVD